MSMSRPAIQTVRSAIFPISTALTHALFIAKKTSSNPDAYIYLADSIRAWPDQKALAAQIVDAGWTQVGWKNLTGGVVAIHMAVAP